MKTWLAGLVMWLAVPAAAQPVGPAPAPGGARWTFDVTGAYTRPLPGGWYAGARWEAAYQTPGMALGVRVFLNERQTFSFDPGDLVVEVRGGSVALAGELRRRFELYRINQPLALFFVKRFRRWELRTTVSLLTQTSNVEAPVLEEVTPGLFFLQLTPVDRERTSVLSNVVAGYRWRRIRVDAGVLALPWLHAGDRDFKFEYRPRAQPYLGLAWEGDVVQLGGFVDAKRFAATFDHTVQVVRPPAGPLQARLTFQTGLDRFVYNRIRARLTVPISRRLQGHLGFDRVWSGRNVIRRDDFERWQRASILGDGHLLNGSLPHQWVEAGLRLTLTPRPRPWPLAVSEAVPAQVHLFPAERDRYLREPVGLVTVRNTADAPVDVELFVTVRGGEARYRSGIYTLQAHEQKTLPFYLDLNRIAPPETPVTEQLAVSARVRGQEAVLATFSVTRYGVHAWSGHTTELAAFLQPEGPAVQQRARYLYRRIRPGVAEAEGPRARFGHLQRFLTALGTSLSYVPDATTTRLVDQVQYPGETLAAGGGDCEDLTVLLASSLMAVGIHTAVVDLRPRQPVPVVAPTADPGRYGHVFLLVDTGIEAAYLNELGLNEFQALTRTGATGAPTLWIPIEPTVLEQGFDEAFAVGVREYYEEVIVRDGMARGQVQVVDF